MGHGLDDTWPTLAEALAVLTFQAGFNTAVVVVGTTVTQDAQFFGGPPGTPRFGPGGDLLVYRGTGSAVQVSTYDPGGDCSPSVTTTTWTGDGSLGAQYPGQVQVSFGSATGAKQATQACRRGRPPCTSARQCSSKSWPGWSAPSGACGSRSCPVS